MSTRPIRIATRKSALALWQAEHIQTRLQALYPDRDITLVPMSTQGDKILDAPLAKVGGKGLFIKELEVAMLNDEADIAVHSMKDVPVAFPDEFVLATICEREDPRDAFVSNHFASFDDLSQGAVVGTSSLRRQCQLKALRPDLNIKDLRGNVNTRLAKLDDGQYDAIILAAAGLIRLGMLERITNFIETNQSLPAVGQGAIGIECRQDDEEMLKLLAPLNHDATATIVSAERAMNARLQGGCQVPIAGFAVLDDDQLLLKGLVGAQDGTETLRAQAEGNAADATAIGVQVAEQLLSQGAQRLLDAAYKD